jgi:hypothetical protein
MREPMAVARYVPALLAAAAIGLPAMGASSTYELEDRSTFILVLPDGWSQAVDPDASKDRITILAKPAEPHAGELRVSPLVIPCEACASDDATLREVTRLAAQLTGEGTAETPVPLQHLDDTRARGYYFTVPETPGTHSEYTYVTYGLIAVDGIRISFTALSKDAKQGTVNQFIEILKRSRRLHADKGPQLWV